MADLIFKKQSEIPHLTSLQLTPVPRLRHAFFTRLGGVSTGVFESLNFRFSGGDDRDTVLINYDRAARLLDGSGEEIVRTNQQHTDIIEVIREAPGVFTNACGGEAVDALMTNVPGVTLAGFYADCQLLIFCDPKKRAIALCHAGWRGVVNEIARKTVERMQQEYGTRPRDLLVAVGPSICRACFVTDDDVYDALYATYGDRILDNIYREGAKWHIDLKSITYASLLSAGVTPYNIDISSTCPCCGDEALWWSHRRNGDMRGVHAGMIRLVP